MLIFTMWDIVGIGALGICTIILVGAVIGLKVEIFIENRRQRKNARKKM